MLRHLRAVLMITSVLAMALASILLLRSYRIGDVVGIDWLRVRGLTRNRYSGGFATGNGVILFVIERSGHSHANLNELNEWLATSRYPVGARTRWETQSPDGLPRLSGAPFLVKHGFSFLYDRFPTEDFWRLKISIPVWFLMVSATLYPALVVVHRLRRWLRRRTGRCMECNYDLRSSTDRCPECGAKIAGRIETGSGTGHSPIQRDTSANTSATATDPVFHARR